MPRPPLNKVPLRKWNRPFKSSQTTDIVRACFLFNSFRLNRIVRQGQEVVSTLEKTLGKRITERLIHRTIFRQFAGGVDAASAIHTMHQLRKRGVGGIPQYSVEQDLEASAQDPAHLEALIEENVKKFVESVEIASSVLGENDRKCMAAVKLTACCNPELLTTVTDQLNSSPGWFDPSHWAGDEKPKLSLSTEHTRQWADLVERTEKIAQVALDRNMVVLVDAEQTYFQPAIRHLVIHHLMPKFNTRTPIIYNTVQCYLKSARKTMEQELQTAKNMAYKYGAKIVRGAYMDAERQLATQKGYEDPIHPTKEDTTNSYYSVMKMALEAVTEGYAHFKIGTHNPNSVREALKCMEELGIAADSGRVSFGQSYGMGNHITYPLGEAGYHVYKIIPYGPVMKVIPYLLRRAKENSSGMGNADEERELLNQELWHRLCMKS